MRNFCSYGAVVLGVCGLSFGPFIWMGQLPQVSSTALTRLLLLLLLLLPQGRASTVSFAAAMEAWM